MTAHRPPTPKDTPSPCPDNNPANPSAHQRKRQRTDDGPSRSGSPVPLTPPHSSRASPASDPPLAPPSPLPLPLPPHRPRASFDSLPLDLQENIVLETVARSTRSPAQVGDYTRSVCDPRLLNDGLEALLRRRRRLTQLATVCRFWRSCLLPLLSAPGPRIVVSADELSALAGNSYVLDGKTVDRPPPPPAAHHAARDLWNDFQPPLDPGCPRRRRIDRRARDARDRDGRLPPIPDVVCWMTSIPWRTDNSEIARRWPRWYIVDWMRRDLDDLKVEKLAVIAAYQGAFSSRFRSCALTPVKQRLPTPSMPPSPTTSA